MAPPGGEPALPPALAQAVEALREVPPDQLAARAAALERVLAAARQELDAVQLARSEGGSRALRELFVGRDAAYATAVEWLARAAGTSLPALIEGERGTGKATLALTLHRTGPRRSRPLRWLEAGAVRSAPELEAAWTSARAGTLALRWVEQLPTPAAEALLELLAGGGASPRIIATSRRPCGELSEVLPAALVDRLRVVRLRLPPLREAPQAVPALFEELVRREAGAATLPEPLLSPDAEATLRAAPWTGNVAELAACAGAAWAAADGRTIDRRHLPEEAAGDAAAPTLEELERRWITERLEALDWHQVRTAHSLGIDRKTLYRKIRRYGLERR